MQPLDIFYEICKIPHPSKNTSLLKEFIIDFAKKRNFNINTDKAGNIHIIKGNPKICLQAHYDMVHIGGNIEPIIENNILRAKQSSLGADNGAAVAAILALSDVYDNFEALITNDEEIGMIGANNIELKIKSKKMINLDSEDINEICVGCAGGFDVDIKLESKVETRPMKYFYKLSSINFQGGHSGIDINKNIKNAIFELLWVINEIDCGIVDINGGEKRNSIPINVTAIIATKNPIKINNNLDTPLIDNNNTNEPAFLITPIKNITGPILNKKYLTDLLMIHNGVYELDSNNVLSSINFSKITKDKLMLMVRANKETYLNRHIDLLKTIFQSKLKISNLYLPWEREGSKLLENIKNIYEKHNIKYEVKEIHAGLECGILKNKCNISEIISIGPTINNPHSVNENMDLETFDKFFEILKDIHKL